MFIPARKARGPAAECTRMPRLLSAATAGAVSVGAAFGIVPAAFADPPPDQRVSLAVDIVGDSYMAGEGIHDTYLNPADPRHRSIAAPALQALSRLESSNARLRVDANIVAASGAQTADFFSAQKGPDTTVVNPPQHDQIRSDSQLVIVGFGGEDAHLATVLADAKRTVNGPNVLLDKEISELGPLLNSTASDDEYFAAAKSSPLGRAPTLVSRMLQVLAGIMVRAPHATIVVTNYPLATDPRNTHAASVVGEDELTSVRKFEHDLNKAIEHAVRLCRCASLLDVSGAVAGHEAYTADSAYNEQPDQQAPRERFQPNQKGASLIANPIAAGIASLLRITPPKASDGNLTVPKNIDIHNGVPARVPESREPKPDTKHTPAAHANPSHQPSKTRPANHAPQPLRGVTGVVTGLVGGLVGGSTPAHGQPPRPNEAHAPAQTPAATKQAQPPAATGQVPANSDRRPATFKTVTDRAPTGSEPPQAPKPAPARTSQPPEPTGTDRGRLWTVVRSKQSSPAENPPPVFAPPPTPAPKRDDDPTNAGADPAWPPRGCGYLTVICPPVKGMTTS